MIPNNMGHFDEFPVDWDGDMDGEYGWSEIEKPCPECGGIMVGKNTEYQDILYVEEVCMSCEYSNDYYE